MKKQLLFVFFLSLSLLAVRAETYKVLFIGNSLTAVNNVPLLVQNLAQSLGDSIYWDSNTPGGRKLQQHAADPTTLGKFSADNWDYVILQAQSQETAFPDGQLDVEIYPAVKFMVDSIHRHNPCTKVLMYMVPGWKYGDNANCAVFADICTYDGQFARIRRTHLNLLDSADVGIAPVGIGFRMSRLADTSIQLWSIDNTHPTLDGSYMAANVIYSSFSGRSTAGASYTAGLSTATWIQNYARAAVFDSISLWNQGSGIHTVAAFGRDQQMDRIVLQDSSSMSDSVYYHITGTCSSLSSGTGPDPYLVDTFLAGGSTISSLIFPAQYCFIRLNIKQYAQGPCGHSDTVSHSTELLCSSIADINTDEIMNIFPNPAQDILHIRFLAVQDQELDLVLNDLNGQIVLKDKVAKAQQDKQINIASLSPGVYILHARSDKSSFTKRIIKE